jgi:hypothetical protein
LGPSQSGTIVFEIDIAMIADAIAKAIAHGLYKKTSPKVGEPPTRSRSKFTAAYI